MWLADGELTSGQLVSGQDNVRVKRNVVQLFCYSRRIKMVRSVDDQAVSRLVGAAF
jgi:hypothetical protein